MSEKTLHEELRRIVEIGENRGVKVRGVGGMAIRSHSHGFAEHCSAVRRTIVDLDLVTYSKHERQVIKALSECGYQLDRTQAYMQSVTGRTVLKNPVNHKTVDLFADKIEYNHTIDVRGRLEKDKYTIPLADLLLQKTQIVEINEKDVKDLILLLREHQIGLKDEETINVNRISTVLSADWGFYYTVMTNMEKASAYAKDVQGLEEEDRLDVLSKIDELAKRIKSSPKRLRWKVRSKIGTRMKWHEDVEELEVEEH